MAKVAVGDSAPLFALKSQTGEVVDLRELVGKKEIVLYFYPKDNTPGCTAEGKAFRDRYGAFKEVGAEVIGVSSDSVDSHRDFSSRCDLPFTILSDEDSKVRKLYGVPSTLGLIPGRVTYIIDLAGKVRHIFNSQSNPTKHVEEAMRALNSVRDESTPATGGIGNP